MQTASRVAFIGDVGGHWGELFAALVALGADPETLELPEGLTVVQCGDLVHRGPASSKVLELVDAQLQRNPSQWVQIIGNHETYYLAPRQFSFHERLAADDIATLRRWHEGGLLRAACAFETEELGPVVATHAGVTSGFWARLGRPDAAGCASRINDLYDRRAWRALCAPGWMLGGGAPSFSAGPIWAEASREVRDSWRGEEFELPFSMVHGHSSPFNWFKGRFQPPEATPGESVVDRVSRHVWTPLGSHQIVGIDPSHGTRGALRWAPLVVTGRPLEGSA